MKKIGVILCSQTKKDYECDVRQMYNDSVSFRARRIFMDFAYDEWYVNTSKYGFMEPSFVLEPYDSWYLSASNTRNKGNELTEEMVNSWLDRVSNQFPNKNEIELHCHLSKLYYDKLKTIFPNIVYYKPQKVFAKTAWKYYDATMMLLNGHTLNDTLDYLATHVDNTETRSEKLQTWYHVDGMVEYGKSSDISKKYHINDLNLWSVAMGDILQTQGWVIDESILQHITKTESGRYMLPRGIAKKNNNMERGDIVEHLDKLEALINGRHYYDVLNQIDDIRDMLNEYVSNGAWDLSVYENSWDLINKHFPNHNLTDDMLECVTYEWLENS